MHNLFGDTAALDVWVDSQGNSSYLQSEEGDSVADMLQYVKLVPETLLESFTEQVKNTGLSEQLQKDFVAEFENGLYGYTYLEEE